MQKILTRDERKKKEHRNQLIIGAILIGLMVVSTAGYALGNSNKEESKSINYKGIEFDRDNSGYWRFVIEGYEFFTLYNPEEVGDINFFNSQSVQSHNGKPLYFVGGFQESNIELSRNLNHFVLRFNGACLDDGCEGDFPVKNCSEDNVIIFEEVDYEEEYNERILQEEGCVFIKTNLANQTRYADAFLFDLLGLR